jgi:hypothetical protein
MLCSGPHLLSGLLSITPPAGLAAAAALIVP